MFGEFDAALEALTDQGAAARCRLALRLLDLDGNGFVTEAECRGFLDGSLPARGGSAITYDSPLDVPTDTYDYSCY